MRARLIGARGIARALCASLALSFAAGPAVGCVRGQPGTIERVVHGERQRGPWISPDAYEHFLLAELALTRGEFQRAIGEYELARSGTIDTLLVAREAEATLALADVRGAERLLREGLRHDPRAEALLLLRARIERERGDLDAAEATLEEARRAAPRSAAAVLALGELLAARGEDPRALALYDAFAASRPSAEAVLRVQLQRALLAHDARRAVLAALHLSRASRSARGELLETARSLLQADDAALAHALLEAIAPLDEESGLRLQVAVAAHDRAAAERLLARMDEDDPADRLRVAEGWLALGEPARALDVAELEPSRDPRARRIAAEALLALDRPVEALARLTGLPAGTNEGPRICALRVQATAAAGASQLAHELARDCAGRLPRPDDPHP